MRPDLFFFYGNVLLLQYESEGHGFSEMFLKLFKKLAARVLSALKTRGEADCF